MSPYIAGYLIIFIPLIFAALTFLAIIPKIDFIISKTASLLSFALILSLIPSLLIYDRISQDLNFGLISISTEYRIDLLGMFFLSIIVFIKIVSEFFYKTDIEKALGLEGQRIFYAVNLINLFALTGIFTTDNILNLYIFIEIYSFTFYVITGISKELQLTKLAFKYFCNGATGSILLLISFLSIYIITGQIHISAIINDINYLLDVNRYIAELLFFLTATSILLKFFPIWLYFEKIKSNDFLTNYLSITSLFIQTNIGLYLLIKLVFFLFGINFSFLKLHFDLALILAGILLVFYSNVKLLKTQNLKLITSFLCLNNLGFIFISIALNQKESLAAAFLFIINYSFINLMIFLFASYLLRNFSSCKIKNLHMVRKENFFVSLPLKIIFFFTCSFPLTIAFLANWNLAYSVMDFNLYLFILVPIITSFFTNIKLIITMINYFYFSGKDDEETEKPVNIKQNNLLYLICFWAMLIIAIGFGLSANILSDVGNRLSVYMLSNTI